jgi:hypothetical protein
VAATNKKTSPAKGRRLTDKQKTAIVEAPADVTNTELAERFETTLQTIARYRTGPAPAGSPRGRGKGAKRAGTAIGGGAHGIQMSFDGDYIVLKIPKKGILKNLMGELLG